MMQKVLKEQKKEHPDTLCISTDPVHHEKGPDEQSRAAPEETVPDEVEREFVGSTRHEDRSINAHMSESSSAR